MKRLGSMALMVLVATALVGGAAPAHASTLSATSVVGSEHGSSAHGKARMRGVHPKPVKPPHTWRDTHVVSADSAVSQQSESSKQSHLLRTANPAATSDPCNASIAGVVTESSSVNYFYLGEIDIYQMSGTSYTSTRFTDPDAISGKYTLKNLCAGTYKIKFNPQSGDDAYQWWGNKPSDITATVITVARSAVLTSKNITLPLQTPFTATYSLQGFPSQGVGTAYIAVQLFIIDGGQTEQISNYREYINGNGLQRTGMAGLPAGTYFITATLTPTTFSLGNPPPPSTTTTSSPVTTPSYSASQGGIIVWTGDPTQWGTGYNPSNPNCACNRSDPVDTHTGDLVEQSRDLSVAGVGPTFSIDRTYLSSRSSAPSVFGNGWASVLNESLADNVGGTFSGGGTGTIVWTQDNGSVVFFYRGDNGSYFPDAQFQVSLSVDADTGNWTVTRGGTLSFTFDSSGHLISESDQHRNATTLARDSSTGLVTAMTAPGSRTFTLTYNTSNLVSKVVDNANRSVTYTYDANANLTAVKDAAGKTTKYAYNTAGLMSTVTNPLNGATKTTYDDSNRVVSQVDPANRATTFAYSVSGDGQSSTTTTTYPDGTTTTDSYQGALLVSTVNSGAGSPSFTTTYVYDGSHNLTSTVDGDGVQSTFTYDGAGNVTAKSVGGTTVMQATYNATHQPTTSTDANGQSLTYTYDSAGDLTALAGPGSLSQSWTFNPTGTIATYTDGNGKVTAYTYSATGLETSIKDPMARTEKVTYTAAGFMSSKTDAGGHKTSFTVDGLGRGLTTTDALTKKTTVTLNGLGEPLTVTDPLGNVATNTYNTAGDLLTRKDATGKVTTFTSTGVDGLVSQVTDPGGNTTKYGYDALHHPIAITDALGNKTVYSYSASGHLLKVTLASGAVRSYAYNPQGFEIRETDALGKSETYTVDGNGNRLTATDALGRTTTMAYRADGKQTSLTLPTGKQELSELDAAGALKKFTDADGLVTTYSYDSSGMLTSKTAPGGLLTKFTYDSAGRLTTTTAPNGVVETKTLDANGRVLTVHSSAVGSTDVTYTYDADGHRVSMADSTGASSMSYDAAGRLLSEANGAGATIGYGYDAIGNIATVSYPGNRTVTYGYDPAGEMTSVKDWSGNTSSFAWDASNRLTKFNAPNGVTQQIGYDDDGRVLSSTAVLGTTPIMTLGYSYDAAGQVSTSSDAGVSRSVSYDANGALAGVAVGQANTPYRASDGGVLQTFGSTTLTSNAAGQLTTSTPASGPATSYSYDANGARTTATVAAAGSSSAQTSAYAYQPSGQLVQVTPPEGSANSVTYTSNGDGLRQTRTQNGSTTKYSWSSVGALPLLLDDGVTSYVYGPQGKVIEEISDATGQPVYVTTDAVGSVRALTKADGSLAVTYSYDVWGKGTASGSSSSALQFEGQLFDASTGLYYLRARDYDPSTGEFLRVDPSVDFTRDAYSFAANNPLQLSDPTGLSTHNDTNAWGLGLEWLSGTGPRHQDFHAGDPLTNELRQHEQIVSDEAAISAALGRRDYSVGQSLNDAGDLGYHLGGADGVVKYIGDYANLATVGHTGNLTVTFLGSYAVDAKKVAQISPDCVTVQFTVTNTSNIASATHLPLYGLIPGYHHWEDFENSLFKTGPLSPTTQTITWRENIRG